MTGQGLVQEWNGMTLRDYLAAHVRVSMGMWMPHVAQFDENDHPINRSMKEMEDVQRQARAKWAYAEADAMIKAREVKP
jgi:hypothetical protein